MGSLLPTGTVTFLFTDIEGSTPLAQRLGSGFATLISQHFDLLAAEIDKHGGVEVKTTGDGVFAVYPSASDAVASAIDIQRRMSSHTWPEGGEIKVRIGLHTGEAVATDDDYRGIEVHRASRVMASGHGGQVLVTETTRLLAGTAAEFRPLGKHLLRGLEAEEMIYQAFAPGLASDFPPLNTATAAPNNLPTRLSTIIGRDDDLSALAKLLGANRLVTLSGPGGIGKTSLAITLGSRVLETFPGGVIFTDLSTVTDPAFVIPSIAQDVGINERTVEGLTKQLRETRTLLILDNFEQVIEATADIGLLISGTSQTVFLVTSQVPLRLPGEQRFVLAPLSVNGSEDSAGVQLFLDRARAVSPGFDADLDAVRDLVASLDGLPLAIELVAARANLLTAEQMLERLHTGRLTYGASVTAPKRHQSLGNALNWSYDLLGDVEQVVYRRLAVFAGGMSLAAAEEVVGDESVTDPLSGIAELVDRSLLIRSTDSTNRFRMLDGVRRHALSLLDASAESAMVRDRYIDHYRHMGSDAYSGLQTDRGEWWRSVIDDELDNFREVLTLLQDRGEAEAGLELLGNTWRFFQSRGHLLELDLWLQRFFALARPDRAAEGSIKGLMARAAMHYWREDSDSAISDYDVALGQARDLGDPHLLAEALFGLAASQILAGRLVEADPILMEAKQLYGDLGDSAGLADVLASEGFAAINRNGLVGVGPVFAEALELYESVGRRIQATQCLFAQSAAAIAEDRLDEAGAFARRGITRGLELNDIFLQVWGLEYVASIETARDNVERGGLFVGAAEAARERIGGGWGPQSVGLDSARSVLESSLGPDRAQELITPGRSLEWADAVELALGD